MNACGTDRQIDLPQKQGQTATLSNHKEQDKTRIDKGAPPRDKTLEIGNRDRQGARLDKLAQGEYVRVQTICTISRRIATATNPICERHVRLAYPPGAA